MIKVVSGVILVIADSLHFERKAFLQEGIKACQVFVVDSVEFVADGCTFITGEALGCVSDAQRMQVFGGFLLPGFFNGDVWMYDRVRKPPFENCFNVTGGLHCSFEHIKLLRLEAYAEIAQIVEVKCIVEIAVAHISTLLNVFYISRNTLAGLLGIKSEWFCISERRLGADIAVKAFQGVVIAGNDRAWRFVTIYVRLVFPAGKMMILGVNDDVHVFDSASDSASYLDDVTLDVALHIKVVDIRVQDVDAFLIAGCRKPQMNVIRNQVILGDGFLNLLHALEAVRGILGKFSRPSSLENEMATVDGSMVVPLRKVSSWGVWLVKYTAFSPCCSCLLSCALAAELVMK